jgi:antitoxin ParD1/3/4
MMIALTPDQNRWLEAQVAAGLYSNVEDAARAVIAERMAVDVEDMDWVRPVLDEARASIAAGHGETFANVQSRLAERIEKLRSEP